MTSDYPLSWCQRGVFWDSRTSPQSCHTVSAFRIRGPLQHAWLEKAWQAVIDRHGALRTTLVTGPDGFPLQREHAHQSAPFFIHDLADATEEKLALAMRQRNEVPYNLESGGGAELHVFACGSEDHLVMLRFHHLFQDLAGTDAAHADLFHAYEACASGTTEPRPPLPHSFAEFVGDEAKWLESDAFETSLAFWREHLQHSSSELELPCDIAAFAAQRKGASLTVRVQGREPLLAFCRETGASRFRVLLTAYAALLNAYSRLESVTIGTPADCRGPKYRGMAGNFINMLPLHLPIQRTMRFREALAAVNQVVSNASAHRAVPFPLLVERLGRRDLQGLSPFFRTTFMLADVRQCPALSRTVMTTHPRWRAHIAGLDIGEPPPLAQQEGLSDLGIAVFVSEDSLYLELKYDPQLFSAAAVRRIAAHYERMLLASLAHPEMRIEEHSLVTPDEHVQLRARLAPPKAESPFEPAQRPFEIHAKQTPEALAVQLGEIRWTYGELNRWADALAAAVQARGVVPEDRVAILLDKSPEVVGAMIGILKAGAAFLPVDPSFPIERIRFMLRDAQVALVVTSARHAHLTEGTPRVDIAELSLDAVPRPATPDGNTAAYIIYTSGSTGQPKGVVLVHRGVGNMGRALVEQCSLSRASRVLAFASLSVDGCIAEIFPTLMAGGSIHFAGSSPTTGAPLSMFLERQKISHAYLPPGVWLSMPSNPLPDLLVGLSVGEACPKEVVARWAGSRKFINGYGPTENTVCTTLKVCDPTSKPTIGGPIPGVIARVLDATLRPVPFGVVGELYLGGESLARGYLHRPDLTEARFIVDPSDQTRLYRTGDLARALESGELDYLGRKDEQIKLRAFRIELSEIEEALRTVPGVTDAAVTVVTVGAAQCLSACIVGDPTRVRATLRGVLPPHMVPTFVQAVPSLPRAPSGKVDRAQLPMPKLESTAREAPRDERERTLATLWREVLGHDEFGATDDFFSVGGDSLTAVTVLHRIGERFGRPLTPDVLMRQGSIRELARILDTREAEHGCIVRFTNDGPGPTLVLVHAAGGELTPYRDLVQALNRGPSAPLVLGIRSASTFDPSSVERSVEQMAVRYAKELVESAPGPFNLVGWSFGGVIAHAIARALPTSKVRSLFLMDASPRIPERGATLEPTGREDDIFREHVRLYAEHQPRQTNINTYICWARGGANARGAWNKVCSVGEEIELDGTHYEILRMPLAVQLADWIAGWLTRTDTRRS